MNPELRQVLKSTSRSLYLSLSILPEKVRDPMALGYLLCRAADSIVDVQDIPREKKLLCLSLLRSCFENKVPAREASRDLRKKLGSASPETAESRLLDRLPSCLDLWEKSPKEEKELLRQVVLEVTEGMLMDLEFFPGDGSKAPKALPDASELERYCDLIGGAPGAFWTRLCLLHAGSLRSLPAEELILKGRSMGRGLQMINILRDVSSDLRLGRCYFPQDELAAGKIRPEELLDPGSFQRLKPVFFRWMGWTFRNLEEGRLYVLSLPRSELRLRAAAAWPLWIGLKTLDLLARSNPLAPEKVLKVSRPRVYGMLLRLPLLVSDSYFSRSCRSLQAPLMSPRLKIAFSNSRMSMK